MGTLSKMEPNYKDLKNSKKLINSIHYSDEKN